MKLNFIKDQGGVLIPADDMVLDKMAKFKNGEVYSVDIKRTRNPAFHRKAFAFFGFCFEYWCANQAGLGELDEHKQSEVFRNNLTVFAGYYDEFFAIDGSVRVEAKSLSFGSMEQAEFEACYSALINAAIKHVFQNTRDEQILNRLQGFF